MASGTITLTSTRDVLEGRIVWSSSSNGSSANSSQVTGTLQVRRNDGYSTKGTWTGSLELGGDVREFSLSSTTVGSSWITMQSFTITRGHNEDGTGICYIGGIVNGPSGTSMSGHSVSGGETVTLDTIPRYLSITGFSVKSKTINTAVISWSTSDPRSSTHFLLKKGDTVIENWTGSATYGENLASDQKSGTFNIKNLSPNTTYKLKIDCIRSDSGLTTVSNEISFTTYDIAKLNSVPNINIGESQTITWTNPSGAFTALQLCKTDDTPIIYYDEVSGTNMTVTPDADIIYALTPNSNIYTARYILFTTQNSKTYTNYKDFTFTVTNSNPTFTNYTYQDTNATTVALTGNNQILIKGYSNLKATVSTDNKAIAKNSANMKSYKLVSGSKFTSVNYSSTADVSLSVNNVDSGTIVLYATDSRGNSTAVTKTATYKEYTDLVIKTVSAGRGSNGVGQDVTLKFNGTYWNDSFGNVTNTITNAKYYYRETSASDWIEGETELTFTTENGQFTGEMSIKGDLGANGFDVSKAYYIRLEVSDGLVTKTYDVTLGSGTPAIAIYKDNVSIGQKYDTSRSEKLQVNGNVYSTTGTYNGYKLNSASTKDTKTLSSIGNTNWINQTDGDASLITKAFMTFWNGRYSDSASNLIYCHQGEIQAKPTSLYDNSSGSNGTITLSQTAANFSYLEIYYAKGGSTSLTCSVKIDSPNDKKVALNWTQFIETWAQIEIGHIEISGTSITRDNTKNGGVNLSGTGNVIFNAIELNIYKVLGYR